METVKLTKDETMENKFLVEITFLKQKDKLIDTMIIACDYEYADYQIRQFLIKKYKNYQVTNVKINRMNTIKMFYSIFYQEC
jgi:ribosomal protein S3